MITNQVLVDVSFPLKAGPEALPLSAQPPTEAVQPSALLDEEAEAVIKKASEGIS